MRGMRAHRWFSRTGFAVQTLGRSGVDQNRGIAAGIAVTQITGLRAALLSVASQTGCALFHHGIILAMTRLAGIQIVAIISQKNEMRGRSRHKIFRMRIAGVAFFAGYSRRAAAQVRAVARLAFLSVIILRGEQCAVICCG